MDFRCSFFFDAARNFVWPFLDLRGDLVTQSRMVVVYGFPSFEEALGWYSFCFNGSVAGAVHPDELGL